MNARNRERPVSQYLRDANAWYTKGARERTVIFSGPLSHGLAMLVLPAVFGALGWCVDLLLGTSPAFMVVFAAFGIVGNIVSAFYRYEARVERDDAGKPWTRRQSTGRTVQS